MGMEDRHAIASMKRIMARIEASVYAVIGHLEAEAWLTREPVSFEARMTGEHRAVKVGESWGRHWDCAWFHLWGRIPDSMRHEDVVLLIDVNGEACVFDEQGNPVRGLTNVSSHYDFTLGMPGKRVLPCPAPAEGGGIIDLWLDAGCNDLFGMYQDNGTLRQAEIARCNSELRGLFYDFQVLLSLIESLPESSARRASCLHMLKVACSLLTGYTEEEAANARTALAPALSMRNGDAPLHISAIGHAHIDLAWLWPIRETKRKGARTFSTVLELMERYPEYRFGASQPQLYQWIKEDHPVLYARMAEKIQAGRWEAQGAMWVEADTNLTGGESLVRQLLLGKRFFRKEFGKEMRVLWLPDVFGYSACLPQLMKKSGVDYFMTIKLSWNEHNRFPHHTFQWEGLDGSRVLAHMPPEGTYNSAALPASVHRAEEAYLEKGISSHALMLYGIGDGGGGPGPEHLERLRRMKDLHGMPPVRQRSAEAFFEDLASCDAAYPVWKGELYLEKHQGTFTSQARSKRYNRMLERMLREAEYVSVLASLASEEALSMPDGKREDGGDAPRAAFRYPYEALGRIWEEVLLYQFHDILPGSSVARVYTESLERYAMLEEQVCALVEAAYDVLCTSGEPGTGVVFNTLSWARSMWVALENEWRLVQVPPLGVTSFAGTGGAEDRASFMAGAPESLPIDGFGNERFSFRIGPDGEILSIFDRETERELLADGAVCNRFLVYVDAGDAWDFEPGWLERTPEIFRRTEATCERHGPCMTLRQVFTHDASTLVQRIRLWEGCGRIDFETEVDWRESGRTLRTDFPTSIHTLNALCGIQFGHVARPTHENTSWDIAKDEVCVHGWVDLSEPNGGVALLNDGKYGHRIREGAISLTLLRSTSYPAEHADLGAHAFTYALYPHAGDAVRGRVAQAAMELNNPLRIRMGGAVAPVMHASGGGALSEGIVQVDASGIIVETVKMAEDGEDVVVRMYESTGSRTRAGIVVSSLFKGISAVDLMEEGDNPLALRDGRAELVFGPFEIHTLRLKR